MFHRSSPSLSLKIIKKTLGLMVIEFWKRLLSSYALGLLLVLVARASHHQIRSFQKSRPSDDDWNISRVSDSLEISPTSSLMLCNSKASNASAFRKNRKR
ncbi:hypothetical protein VTI28DRAFT_2624 [Corynascus sepedonium]